MAPIATAKTNASPIAIEIGGDGLMTKTPNNRGNNPSYLVSQLEAYGFTEQAELVRAGKRSAKSMAYEVGIRTKPGQQRAQAPQSLPMPTTTEESEALILRLFTAHPKKSRLFLRLVDECDDDKLRLLQWAVQAAQDEA